jgi:signal transduction histidine kinase
VVNVKARAGAAGIAIDGRRPAEYERLYDAHRAGAAGPDLADQRRTRLALQRINTHLEREAARIAGALHDEAGQFVAAAQLTVNDLLRQAPPHLGVQLRMLHEDIAQIAAQLRRASHDLYPSILDNLGLIAAIDALADTFTRRTGVQITVDARMDPPCAAHVQSLLYRFVQEALTNIGTHAGAHVGRIVLRRAEAHIWCSVRDDGSGFDLSEALGPGKRGRGLTLMRDRLEAAGGRLEIISSPGWGAELRGIIPEEG